MKIQEVLKHLVDRSYVYGPHFVLQGMQTIFMTKIYS